MYLNMKGIGARVEEAEAGISTWFTVTVATLLFGNQVLARVAVNSDGNMFSHHAVTFPLMHATGFLKNLETQWRRPGSHPVVHIQQI